MEKVDLNGCLALCRNAFGESEDGEARYSFSCIGKGRGGKEIEARVKLDKFFYHQADAYFGDPTENVPIYLRKEVSSFTNNVTGELVSSDKFIAFTVDEEGFSWGLPVIPFGASDKLVLNTLFARLEWNKAKKE